MKSTYSLGSPIWGADELDEELDEELDDELELDELELDEDELLPCEHAEQNNAITTTTIHKNFFILITI